MIRLLWKELRFNRWMLAVGLGVVVVTSLLGDPLFFRGDSPSDSSYWLVLIMLLTGLRAYSNELAGDTVQFLGSRPIRWWQIWLAKTIVGLIQVTAIVLVAAVLYALLVPTQYKPFLVSGIISGVKDGFVFLTIYFGLGMAVSVLMPGVYLSAAALVLVAFVIFLPFPLSIFTANNTLMVFMSDTYDNSMRLMYFAIPLAGMVVAWKLPKLNLARRWLIWMAFPYSALVIGALKSGLDTLVKSSHP